MMIKKRPINRNPLSMRLPLPALVSIMHRMSGVLVFLLIPFILFSLQQSLNSEQSFLNLKETLNHPICALVIWVGLTGLVFHLLAGFRHMLMDIHLGDSLKAGRMSAMFIFLLTMLFAITWIIL